MKERRSRERSWWEIEEGGILLGGGGGGGGLGGSLFYSTLYFKFFHLFSLILCLSCSSLAWSVLNVA